MSTPAWADASPSEARDHGSSAAIRYQTPSHTVTVLRSTPSGPLTRCALVLASLGRMSTASCVPSRVIEGSARSTIEPGIVPVTVPSMWTAEASRVACSERATISLGSVTRFAGMGGARGPTPNTGPGAEHDEQRHADHGEAAQDSSLGHVIRHPIVGRAGPWSIAVGLQARACGSIRSNVHGAVDVERPPEAGRLPGAVVVAGSD